MNLKQSENFNLIIRSLLTDETANTTMAHNTFASLGLLLPDGKLNKPLVLKHLRKDRGATLRFELGMGRGAFIYMMRLMLESI